VPIFLSIPNYIAVDIVPNEVTINETNGESGPNGNLIFITKNITKYVINFNELAMSNDRFFKELFFVNTNTAGFKTWEEGRERAIIMSLRIKLVLYKLCCFVL
jgi:hypothetical protein